MPSPVKQKLDCADLRATPDDGNRYEIVLGELLVTPASSPRHQLVPMQLAVQLVAYFHGRSSGRVLCAPVDVLLSDADVVQPDLVVVDDLEQISERGIEGPPLLAVEILSPSTRDRDRGLKARRYLRRGVRHYWLIDPEARRVECLRSDGGEYRSVAAAEGNGKLRHADYPGLVLDLASLWR